MADPCKAMENAVAIVSLRLSEDEWARGQGEKMLPQISTPDLLAVVAREAVTLRAEIIDAALSGGADG